MDEQLEQRMRRMRGANLAIKTLGRSGPRFLHSMPDDRDGRLAVDRYGQTWYVDGFTGMMLYPFEGHAWKGFSSGEQLKLVVMALANYVHAGQLVDLGLIERVCAEAYGAEWPRLHDELASLQAFGKGSDA